MLATGSGGGLWLVFGIPSGCGGGNRSIVLDLLEAFPDRSALRIVGERVLRSVPEFGDAKLLSETLLSHPRWSSKRDPGRLFAEQVAEDFEAGRVMNVAGWILAQSEARLCGLVVLLERTATGLPR
jgi:hypothetical protein